MADEFYNNVTEVQDKSQKFKTLNFLKRISHYAFSSLAYLIKKIITVSDQNFF